MTENYKQHYFKRPELETRLKTGKILIEARRQLCFSAKKVARVLDISYSAYRGYEQGKTWPRKINQEKMCNLYGLFREKVFPSNYNFPEIIPLSQVEESIPACNMREEVEREILVGELPKFLTSKEKIIIELYYSLNGGGPYTLEEIGNSDKIKLSRERVRQIEVNTLEKLRKVL